MQRLILFSFLTVFGTVPASSAFAQDITGISPMSGFPGQTVRVAASGSGLSGPCSVTLTSGADLTFSNCNVSGARSLSFLVTVDSAAAPGTRTIEITHGGGAEEFGFTVAAGEPAPGTIPIGPQTGTAFIDLLDNIVDWVFVVVLVGAGVFIVLAGWQFISGGGEPQAVAQARTKLLWAAVGIGVAVLSQGIVAAVRSLIGS